MRRKRTLIMTTLTKILLTLCVTGLVLGIAGIGNTQISGLALALGAVTFVLSFITHVIGKAESEHIEMTKEAPVPATSAKDLNKKEAVVSSALPAIK